MPRIWAFLPRNAATAAARMRTTSSLSDSEPFGGGAVAQGSLARALSLVVSGDENSGDFAPARIGDSFFSKPYSISEVATALRN